MTALDALDAALPRLRCPVCCAALVRDATSVRCTDGHAFDVARQGYVNLAVGQRAGTADTAAMVAARERFLGAGHYRAIADAVARAAGYSSDGFVVDLAGGTGYHLAAVLDRLGEDARGACVDLSAPALRRAARCHPRAAAVGADAWQPLPFGDGAADVVLSVFGPRDAGEIERVLTPGGALVTVSPRPDHLRELVDALGLIGVDPDKPARSAAAFGRFALVAQADVNLTLRLGRDDAYDAAAMGPSAWHVPADELRARADALDAVTEVGAAVDVRTYRSNGPGDA